MENLVHAYPQETQFDKKKHVSSKILKEMLHKNGVNSRERVVHTYTHTNRSVVKTKAAATKYIMSRVDKHY